MVACVLVVIVVVKLRGLPEEGRSMFSGSYLLLSLGVAFSSMTVGVLAARWAIETHRSGLVLVAALLAAARYLAIYSLRRGERRRRDELALIEN